VKCGLKTSLYAQTSENGLVKADVSTAVKLMVILLMAGAILAIVIMFLQCLLPFPVCLFLSFYVVG
jgi:hypothetical protein